MRLSSDLYRDLVAAFAFVLLLCACTDVPPGSLDGEDLSSTPPLEVTGPESASRIDLIVEPFADFYFRVRAQAADVVDGDPSLEPVVTAWMPVQREIGTFGGFWRFDLAGLLAKSPQEFNDWFADYPETVPSRRGGTIPIKGPGVAMAEAMEGAWPQFVESDWPLRRERIEDIRERLERGFQSKHRAALGHMLRSLGIEDPKLEVPLTLVLETNPPGALTYRSQGGPVVVMSIDALLEEDRFSDLEETILHETCHVLDLASQGDDDAFTVLRALLRERGLGDEDPRLHDIPHLLMFAQAENTMRRLFDSEHVAYGDSQRGEIAPLYERSGRAAVVVRQNWSDYLDGEIDRDEALFRIAEELVPSAGD